ncbi:unnamed protein product [Polarella glacialis]|uniref:Uncharacterized protein n=1 Tax=Polarella glacialis TaxID=89957 RepID=A0A813FZH3_POLGL|nr:unnamed protein product [Polarella glacialis]
MVRSLVAIAAAATLAVLVPGAAAANQSVKGGTEKSDTENHADYTEHKADKEHKEHNVQLDTPDAEKSKDSDSYQQYMAYEKYVQSTGQGSPMKYDKFMASYNKYMDYKKYMHQSTDGNNPAGFQKFMDDYQKYMDFKSYMNQGSSSQSPADFKKFMDFQAYIKANPGSQVPASFQKFTSEYSKFMAFKKYTKSTGGAESGDFQQYMEYDKYLKQGGQSSAESQGPADFQKSMYFSKYMGGKTGGASPTDFQKYMDFSKYTGGKGGASAGAGGSDFQQYMDFSKYTGGMGGSGAGADGSAGAGGSGFQKYMDFSKYTGGMGGSGAGASGSAGAGGSDFQQYMDFSKYTGGMGGSGAGASGSAGAGGSDFQQYMDFSKYTGGMGGSGAGASGSAGAGGSDFQKYMDFSKYTGGMGGAGAGASGSAGKADEASEGSSLMADDAGSSDDPTPTDSAQGGAGGQGDYKKYMDFKKYMGISGQYTNKDWMSKWQEFQQKGQASQGKEVPHDAKDCKTVEELKAWKDGQVATTKEWIPKMFQKQPLDSIEKDYKSNMDRIENGTPLKIDPNAQGAQGSPSFLAAATPPAQSDPAPAVVECKQASECETKAQLTAWKKKQIDQLDKYVPKAYQKYSLAPIEAEYKKQLLRIESGAATAGPAPAATDKQNDDTPRATEKARMAVQHLSPKGAQTATSVEELVAWRAESGAVVDQLPLGERQSWTDMLNQELEDGLGRLQSTAADASHKVQKQASAAEREAESAAGGNVLLEAGKSQHPTRWNRVLMVGVLTLALPMAGLYVYRGIQQAKLAGTDYDAAFIALDASA